MSAYEVIRNIHHLGSPLVGTVTDCTEIEMYHGIPGGHLTLETTSEFRAILPYQHLVDDHSRFSADLIPNLSSTIKTVVFNFVDGTLYLSAKPHDLKSSTIQEWCGFYNHISTLTVGYEITGIVEKATSFGLFVNIGSPYIGLIDIGHTHPNHGHELPLDYDTWPKAGDKIRCIIGYFRIHDRQIGLGWIPDTGAA